MILLTRCRVSTFYLAGLFSLWNGIKTLAISAVGTYAIAQYISGPFMPWIGFVFLMGHLAISHIQRQILGEPGIVDVTGAQMVLVMKLSAFCWNVADGRLPASELSAFQKERALKTLPSPLNYAAWVLFFPSLFGGPAFDYVDYRNWIECTMFELPPGADPLKKAPTRKKRKIPRSGTPAMWKAAGGLFWILLFLKFSGFVYNDIFTGQKFLEFGFFKRVWFLYLLGFTARLKYYGVWALTEGACILSGLGYNGVDQATGKVSWDRLQNVNPWGVETAQNSRAYLGNWNMNTNHWLRNYIYLRVTPKGKKPGFRASMATFTTSAFWHGFYPGYYLSFITASFLQTVAKSKSIPRSILPIPISTLTIPRLPPLFPPLLRRPRERRAHPVKNLLRLPLLVRHAIHALLHHRSVPDPLLQRVPPRLGARLLLRRVRHRRHDRLLRLPRKVISEETDRGQSGEGEWREGCEGECGHGCAEPAARFGVAAGPRR